MKIIVERPKCIGCGSCAAVCPQYFEMAENNLAHLKDSIKNGENEELEVSDPACAKDAVEICPVQIIHLQ